tara:strand:+ start:810 stop:974 length:165 start_codon:yes stop_codon:yes gene_type:complete
VKISKQIIFVGYLLWSTRLAMSGLISEGLKTKRGCSKRKKEPRRISVLDVDVTT